MRYIVYIGSRGYTTNQTYAVLEHIKMKFEGFFEEWEKVVYIPNPAKIGGVVEVCSFPATLSRDDGRHDVYVDADDNSTGC